jgi:hypothetical protein
MTESNFSEKPTGETLYSCDDFTIHQEENIKTIRFKKNYGRLLPYVIKNGVIEAIILPKESEGLIKYETNSLDQLSEIIKFCEDLGWKVTKNNFTHLGFWRSNEFLDHSECVWGLDIESTESSSEIISNKNFVILPISVLLSIGDALSAAAGLKLLVKIHSESKEVG